MRNLTIAYSLIFVFLLAVLLMPELSQAQSITVVKATTPTGQGPFSFTSSTAPTNFILDGGESQNFPALTTPGDYTITEVVPPGSDLVITSNAGAGACGTTTVTPNNATGVAMISLDGTCDLTVTYTNTGNATITINKDTVPVDNNTVFDFTSNLPGQSNFSLTSVQTLIVNNVLGGIYNVTEAIEPGYSLADVSCNDPFSTSFNPSTRTLSIEIDEDDDNISCTFTNVPNGEIIIQKSTVPAGGMGFSFDENITAPNGTFMLNDGGSMTFMDVSPGTYTVTEDNPTVTPGGFILTDIVCDDMGSSTNVANRTATIDLDSEEVITCTFTNTAQLEGLTVIKTDVPDPVSAGEELSYIIDIQNGSDFVATNVMLVDDLPNGMIGVSAEGNINGVDCEFDNILNPETVTCTLPDLPPLQILAVTIKVIPNPSVFDGDPVIVENLVTLTAQPGNEVEQAMTQTLVTPQVEMEIERGNENRIVDFGQQFTIQYDISNIGTQQALSDLNSVDAQVRADALDVMLEVDFPDALEVQSVQTTQGNCTIGSVNCNLGNILEGQTVSVSIVFKAPDFRDEFTVGALVTVLGGQSFQDFLFVTVRNDSDNCSLAPAGTRASVPMYVWAIPLFIVARRYLRRTKTRA